MESKDLAPSRLRVGLVGAGFMGEVHSRAIRASGAQLVAVATRTAEDTRRATARLGALHGASPEEVLQDPDIDVVHICTPNVLHASQAARALEAGKHVVCEKPLATSVADAQRLQDLAVTSGRVAAVPFVYRYYPTVRLARKRLAGSGDAVKLIHGSYLQDWVIRAPEESWRHSPATGGPSGAFADIGIHWCDLVEFVSGHRITAVQAQFPASTDSPQLETAAAVLFRTDRGAIGTLVVSQVTHGRKNRLWFSIDSEATSVSFDQENPEHLWVGTPEGSALLARGAGGDSAAGSPLDFLPAGHPQGYQDCFNAFVSDTYTAIAMGTEVPGHPLFRDGLRGAHITDAVLRSAGTGGWTQVPAIP